MFSLSQKRRLKLMWWKQPSVTKAEERVTGGQWTWRPLDSPANAGTLSIPTTTHLYLKPTPASESGTHMRQPSTHSLTHQHAVTGQAEYRLAFSVFSRDLRENYCRNPDGQESPWCFTTDPRVRTMPCLDIPQCGAHNKPVSGEKLNSFIRHWKQRGKADFLCIWSREISGIVIFCGLQSSYETL